MKFYRRFLASQNQGKINLDLPGCLVKVSGPSLLQNTFTTKNTVISSNFLVWKICGKAQFPDTKFRGKMGIKLGFLDVFSKIDT